MLDRYLLSVLILIFYFTYVGQAWNLMMGFAGQLSLGHALYFGIGAYSVGLGTASFGLPFSLALAIQNLSWGVIVSLVWLYLEILRLLSYFRNN